MFEILKLNIQKLFVKKISIIYWRIWQVNLKIWAAVGIANYQHLS